MNHNWQRQKQSLFSHANPSYAIKQMKSITHHLNDTKNLLHGCLQTTINIKETISNTSNNLQKTNELYEDGQSKLKKGKIYVSELQKRQKSNQRNIKLSFLFLVVTFFYIIIRRILFPNLYRW